MDEAVETTYACLGRCDELWVVWHFCAVLKAAEGIVHTEEKKFVDNVTQVCNCDNFVGQNMRHIAVLEEEVHKSVFGVSCADEAFPANVPGYINMPFATKFTRQEYEDKYISGRHCWLSQTVAKYDMIYDYFMWELRDDAELHAYGGRKEDYADGEVIINPHDLDDMSDVGVNDDFLDFSDYESDESGYGSDGEE